MPHFDWRRFLDANRIAYVEAEDGANLSKGNIGIACPFCGDDPSTHMGISLAGAGWNCWRDRSHKGKSPVGLIQVLLKCSWERAREIAGLDNTYVPEDWCSQAMALIAPKPTPAPKKRRLLLPSEFLEFSDLPRCKPYLRYMENRGFTLTRLQAYGIKYCTTGPFRARVIFPVTYGFNLVSWTGRTINGSPLRYRAHTADPERAADDELPPALGPINSYLLWYDHLRLCETSRFKTLVLCEGPIDAFKVAVLGQHSGITATCFFGIEPTDTQIELLYDLVPRFERTVVLSDRNAETKSMQTAQKLKSLGVEACFMVPHRSDPGELRTCDELLHSLGR